LKPLCPKNLSTTLARLFDGATLGMLRCVY